MRKAFMIAAAVAALFTASVAHAETKKIGVTPGPHAQIMEKVKEIAAKNGLDLQVIEFSDYVVPNQALADGDLDINSFQHQPYLDRQIADRKFDLVSVGQTVNFPMGGYSKKVKELKDLKDGSSVALPNDPSNGARALLILADQGLIKLRDGAGAKATVADVIDNPKNLKLVELDAAQLPRSLDDVDVAVINSNYAIEAGMNPSKDSLFREGLKAPYANVIAVRKADANAPWVKTFLDSYHTPEVKAFIETTFKGSVVPAWQ
ncbi:D-methionine transport system substrate-binding protein [Insolitispirillum peregrinum]|uniref:D-methionine transport system substrate-binding protein n=2 Tax=Insolitispirillum peregrinum TaxID=80876 RepID=A0A1N7L1J4_9PROT|nr:D-methionine transport system substrate-binding protein [Insolitispirillum peregrinum]